jgi:isopentenyl diphosphate isomerase/L-lactate dehydrogenase-like FMN-dependent dehydrogenase
MLQKRLHSVLEWSVWRPPILRAALESEQSLEECMARVEHELKIAVFCTGMKSVSELFNNDEVLQWQNH